MSEYTSNVAVMESFLQHQDLAPPMAMASMGGIFYCYGEEVARWEGDKLIMQSPDAGDNVNRSVRRAARWLKDIAKVRGIEIVEAKNV